MYISHFVCPFIQGGHLSHFYLRAIVNNAALSILVGVKGFGVFIGCIWHTVIKEIISNILF